MRPKAIRSVLALSALGLFVMLGTMSPAPLKAQQPGGLPALEKRVAALEALLATKSQEISTLQAALEAERTARLAADAALANRAATLEDKTQYLSVVGTETYFTGTNLHIRNGLGATNGNPDDPRATSTDATEVNGLGNLVIGYNASGGFGLRSGSHYLVLGDFNDYSGFGGIVAGRDNSATGAYASTLGGRTNQAPGPFSTVVGGAFNVTDGHTAAILGGDGNRASDIDATVCGGAGNRATARFSNVSGGRGIVQSTEFGWSAGSLVGPYIQGSFGSP